jgi:hypothetical protein
MVLITTFCEKSQLPAAPVGSGVGGGRDGTARSERRVNVFFCFWQLADGSLPQSSFT